MAAQTDSYYLRRKSGSPIGPFSPQILGVMLQKGTLDGSEEVSRDRRNWVPVRDVGSAPPMPAPPLVSSTSASPPRIVPPPPPSSDLGFSGDGGTEVLSVADGHLIMHDPAESIKAFEGGGAESTDGGFASPSGVRPAPGRTGTSGGIGPPAPSFAGGGGRGGGGGANSPGLAFELDAADLIPLELAALEPAPPKAASKPKIKAATVPRLGPLAPMRESAAPVVMLLADSDGLTFDQTEPLGSMPLLPTIQPDSPVSAIGPGDLGRGTSGMPAVRHRTMSAVRQRPVLAAPVKPQRNKMVIAGAIGGATVIVVGTFFALGGVDLVAGEPTVASVLGSVVDDIEQNHYPAYEQGAQLLITAAAAHPKSVRLRAAAVDLLARSVVVRRADRGRVGKAEAILAEIPAGHQASLPELARARGWVALAKGNVKEASRLAIDASSDPSTALLLGWTQIADGKAGTAAKTFEEALARTPDSIPLRYALGRAQEDTGLPAAIATYQALLTRAPWHFGAGLAVIRAASFPPAGRITLAETLIKKNAADASRTELADAQVLIARAARLIGKVDRADSELKQAQALDPGDPGALVAAGEALLDQGRLKEAIAKFEVAAPNAPAVPVAVPLGDLRIAMAATLIEKGKFRSGLALLEPVPATDPRARFWRARAAELANPPDLEAARRGYQETLKSDPRFVPATLQLATLLTQQQQGAEGLAVLKRAEAAGASGPALQLALGQAFLASGDTERAKKTFNDALADNPKLTLARLGLATAYKAAGSLAAAKAELDALSAQAADTPGLRQATAELLIAQGQKDQALATYRAEIDAGRATPALKMAAARLALDTGHADVARDIAEKIVADNPETPGALVLLGRIRRALGDLPGAVAELRRALAFESTPELHYEYGRVLLESGSNDEGLAELEQAPTLAVASIERARVFMRRGDAERAVGPLELAVKQAPASGEAWLLLGNAYDRLGNPAKAESAWKSAIKAEPAAPEPRYRLGRLEMDQGQPGPALVHLRAAAAKVPPGGVWTADFYFQLGYAEKARGTRPAAAAALKKYLQLAPADAPSRNEVERLLGEL
jgi:tetratricopeptide (TPR) repeat protein